MMCPCQRDECFIFSGGIMDLSGTTLRKFIFVSREEPKDLRLGEVEGNHNINLMDLT